MTNEPHDDASPSRRQRRGRRDWIQPRRAGRPRFCIEMLDAAFMDSEYSHRVVTGTAGGDGVQDEWIEVDAPTDLYANSRGDHRLTVTVRIEAGAVRILATEVYPRGSLRSPPHRPDRPHGARQLLWLAHPRSGLVAELVADSSGRIDAIFDVESVGPFNRADVPKLVRSFASAVDFVEQTVRDTGLREDRSGI